MNRLVIFLTAFLVVSCSGNYKGSSKLFELPEVQDVVMYQINPRVFAETASFNAVTAQLDSIAALGVNVLWFMPVYEIGVEKSVNSPYCIKDYYKLNPEFGTPEEFGRMVEAAHDRGLGVILDWVANHTSWDSDWVRDHPEWYSKDESGNIIHPAGTGWKDVADLDFSDTGMRGAMIDAMKYWVEEFGIDGFRCDAADFVPFDFWKQAVDSLRAIPDHKLLMLAEGKRKDHFDAGFDMNYAWNYLAALRKVYHRNASVSVLGSADSLEYAGVLPGKVKLRFTTNHDEAVRTPAVKEFVNEKGAMAAFVATTFIHGGMLIYGSQEVGYPEGIDFFEYVPVDWKSNPEYREEYKKLVRFYNGHPAVRRGSVSVFPDDDVLMFERTYGDDSVFVAVNLRDVPVRKQCRGTEINLEPFGYILDDLND